MKSFQTTLAWGMAAALVGSAGCAPTERDFTGQGAAGAASGSGGAGGSGMTSSAASQGGGGTASTGGTKVCQVDDECDDGNLCTQESCKDGVCSYAPIVIDDKNVCTKDSCTPELGPRHDVDANCCPHSICTVGPALNKACLFTDQTIDCATEVCKLSPSCCSSAWDAGCVETAKGICVAGSAKNTCACAHSYCQVGAPLDPECDPCVHAVCSVTPSCCASSGTWDSNCVTETHQYCNIPLGANCQ